MKQRLFRFLVLVAILTIAGVVFAGQVYDRDTTTPTAAGLGICKWTNNVQFSALKLARIWIESDLVATDVVTIVRIYATGGLYTQSVGSVTCASGIGSTASFTAGYLKYGDILRFTGSNGTNYTALIEYEVQQH